jgi:hypothetical protein
MWNAFFGAPIGNPSQPVEQDPTKQRKLGIWKASSEVMGLFSKDWLNRGIIEDIFAQTHRAPPRPAPLSNKQWYTRFMNSLVQNAGMLFLGVYATYKTHCLLIDDTITTWEKFNYSMYCFGDGDGPARTFDVVGLPTHIIDAEGNRVEVAVQIRPPSSMPAAWIKAMKVILFRVRVI